MGKVASGFHWDEIQDADEEDVSVFDNRGRGEWTNNRDSRLESGAIGASVSFHVEHD